MKAGWVALGVVGFAVCLVAVFGVVYAAVEFAGDDAKFASENPQCADAVAFFSALDASRQYHLEGVIMGPPVDALFSDWADARIHLVDACSN